MQTEIDETPIKLCGQKMNQFKSVKYLGDHLSECGLQDSINLTVLKRKGLVVRSVYEIKSVVDDCRSHLTGGLISGFDLWEMAILPMLLYNCETSYDMSKNTLDMLEGLQLKFLRSVLAVGSGCPLSLLYSETGMICMELRILEKKLNFLHHLYHLPSSALAKEVLEIQTRNGLPGIYAECKEFLARFEVFDLSKFSKSQFKRFVKSKIKELNKNRYLELAKINEYKKIDFNSLSDNDFELKAYLKELNVTDARLKFKIVSQMTPGVKMNFQSDKKFAKDLWKCTDCAGSSVLGRRDTQQHLIICPGYEAFREGRNLDNDSDLISYYKDILQHRMSS